MTIHKSKGLEFPICYYAGLYKEFNKSDIKDRLVFDNKYGFIIPAKRDGLKHLVTKDLLKSQFVKEEVSEKIRLLYVALTRSKEKIIILAPLKGETINNDLIIPKYLRLKCKSFLSMFELAYSHLKKYVKTTDVTNLLTKEYNQS